MIVAVGRNYTKQIDSFMRLGKTYDGTAIFGTSTDSYDADGEIETVTPVPETLTEETIKELAQSYTGDIKQVPPAFSAKKVNGKRSYDLARQGLTVTLDAKDVTVYHYDIHNYQPAPDASFQFKIDVQREHMFEV